MKIMVSDMPDFPYNCVFARGFHNAICQLCDDKCELNQDPDDPDYGTCPYLAVLNDPEKATD